MTSSDNRIGARGRLNGPAAVLVLALASATGGHAQVPFEQVIANLKSPDVSARIAALRQLREASYPEAIGPVAALLADPDERVQTEAIETELSFFLAKPVAMKRRVALVVEVRGPTGAEAAFEAVSEVLLPRKVPPELTEGLLAAVRRAKPSVQVQVLYLMGVVLRPPVAPSVAEGVLPLIGRSTQPVRRAAARVAGRLRLHAAGEELVYRLNDSDAGVRLGAMEALGWLREASAVPALAALVEFHGHKGEGLAALETLARIGDTSNVGLFAARLTDRNAEVRRMAAEGIGRAGAVDQVRALEATLGDERSASVRLALSFALHRLGRPSVPPLVQALTDAGRRLQARGYLVDLGPDTVGPLQDYLRSPDAETRAEVASVLGAIGDDRAIPSLEALAADPDEDVRTTAADAVRRLRLAPAR